MATIVFTRSNAANRGASSYQSADSTGTIILSKAAFNGVHPDTISINDVPEKVASTPKVKETKEERKARLSAMTPAQRLEAAEKRLADKRAKLMAKGEL